MTKSNLILCIETTTEVCSVALSSDGKRLNELSINEPNAHGTNLTLLIDKLIQASGYTIKDLDAVAYSSGPGSYTGLRIGLSVAKGICFGNNIPLIDVPTLSHITLQAIQLNPDAEVYLPMLDARRMEVYTALINKELELLIPPFACLLEEFDWDTLNTYHRIAYFGNGALKASSILSDRKNFVQIDNFSLHAGSICSIADKKFNKQEFADLALHTPFYLKNANVTPSKKKPI